MSSSEARLGVTAAVAFVAGAALVWVPFSAESLPFRETPRYPVWVFLIAIVCGSCPIVWSLGVRAVGRLRARRPRAEALGYGGAAVLLALALVWIPAFFPSGSPGLFVELMPFLGRRFMVVYLATALAIVPGIIAMYRIGGACKRGEVRAADLVAWRVILQSQLGALGALIVLGTLTTGAFRNAILAAFPDNPDAFPAEWVLLFGAALTMIVALIYVPPSNRLRRRAQTLVDERFPIPNEFEGDWQQQLQRRNDLAAALHADQSSRTSIQNALIIAGPLISTALTLLVPTN